MLLSLLLVNKMHFLFFFHFLPIVFKYIFRISLPSRTTRLALALEIPIGTPTVAKEQRETLLLVPDKASKVLSAYSSTTICLLNLLLIFSLSLISETDFFLFIWLYWVWIVERFLVVNKYIFRHTHVVHSYLYFILKYGLEYYFIILFEVV